jgi:hypothetical protein
MTERFGMARRSALAFAVLAACCCLGCAGSPPAGDGGVVPGGQDLDSFGLIDQAVSAGRIDYSTGILYKVYAAYEPMSLPEEYRSDVPLRGATSLVSEVERNWNRLTEEHRAEIAAYIQPAADPDEHDTGLDDVTPDRLEHERNRLD